MRGKGFDDAVDGAFRLFKALPEMVLAGDNLHVLNGGPVSSLAVYDFQADRGIDFYG